MPRRRHHVVALTRARHPPAADLDRLCGIAHVDAAIELVVVGVRGREVGRARRAMHVFAVAEPQLVHPARGRARAVEERDRPRLLRNRDVEQLHAGGLQPLFLRLVGHRHDVPAGLERIRAHVGLRQVGLHHHLGLARIGHVDGGEILRRAFVREPEDAAAVGRDLDRHAFAHAAEAVEQVMADELEIPGNWFAVAAWTFRGRRSPRRGFLCCGFFPRRRLGPLFRLGSLLRDLLACDFHSTLHAVASRQALARLRAVGEMGCRRLTVSGDCRPTAAGCKLGVDSSRRSHSRSGHRPGRNLGAQRSPGGLCALSFGRAALERIGSAARRFRAIQVAQLAMTNQAGCGVGFLSGCGVRPPRKRAIGS